MNTNSEYQSSQHDKNKDHRKQPASLERHIAIGYNSLETNMHLLIDCQKKRQATNYQNGGSL